MFKDLLVATTGQGDDAAAVATACAIAQASAGHVAVLVPVRAPMPVGDGMGGFPVQALVSTQAQAQVYAGAEADCARWRDVLDRAGIPGDVRLVDDPLVTAARTAALQAHYCDLVVIGLGAPGRIPAEVHDQAAMVLSGSGRPLMVVPAGYEAAPKPRVVIAWRPGASASRAVHDAMPFLRHSHAIDVLCVDPRRGGVGDGDEPGADIATHLARHDLAVTVHVEATGGEDPGEVLLRRTRELGANLLVMGGYSHSRLREWALGGTTRHVLKHADVPVMMSH
jgi:nucleotide-binding universal stress UspA family protein